MARLQIRMLGGFDARLDGEPVEGFESQKVRALLALLAFDRDKALSRDRLSSLLWEDKSSDTARRNLRQALHNLRAAFSKAAPGMEVVLVGRMNLQIHPEADLWADVHEFCRAMGVGRPGCEPALEDLEKAAGLYAGDFLASFFVKESSQFEEWMILEQERLRELAIGALRSLIAAYVERGDLRQGIARARHLLSVDPLSEHAHRQLMRLYALTGRRGPALALFEKLRNLLNQELGVEPLEETTLLYDEILAEDMASDEVEQRAPLGPIVPMVGRGECFSQLQESWNEVLQGKGRATLIHGEPGIGKTRLMKSFVGGLSAHRRVVVLWGRCYEASAIVPYQVVSELLASTFAESLPEERARALEGLSPETRNDLARLCPTFAEDVAGHAGEETEPLLPGDGSSYVRSLVEFVDHMRVDAQIEGRRNPLILLVDDLQWADGDSLELLRDFLDEIWGKSVWMLATCRPGEEPDRGFFSESGSDRPGSTRVERVSLRRLATEEIEKIVKSLVVGEGSEVLSTLLAQWSGGLPLAVSEMLNLFWDRGVLRAEGNRHWTVMRDPGAEAVPPAGDLRDLMLMRVRRLPSSTRRLLSMAAILGQEFDAKIVQRAEGEHPEVVAHCIRLVLERWIVRQSPKSWSLSRREGDLLRWVKGSRRGPFEFAHEELRAAILEDLNPLRRQAMHRQVAATLIAEADGEPRDLCERIVHHLWAGGEQESELPYLEAATLRARGLGATEAVELYVDKQARVLDHLIRRAANEPQKRELQKRLRELS